MIPKIIHYCWFGKGNKPKLAEHCIQSWKIYCPDFKIIEWNEDNFDLDLFPYVREAYDNRKYAFVTDVVRLYVLTREGGFYMDTDVEVIKPLDSLCKYEAVSGFEAKTKIPTGLMACRKGFPLFQEFLKEYEGIHFVNSDGSFDLTTNVTRITNICLKYGFEPNGNLQTVSGFTLLPQDFLCPKDWITRKINCTDNTLCIHHFDGSWLSKKEKSIQKIKSALGPELTTGVIAFKAFLRKRNLIK